MKLKEGKIYNVKIDSLGMNIDMSDIILSELITDSNKIKGINFREVSFANQMEIKFNIYDITSYQENEDHVFIVANRGSIIEIREK